MRRNSYRLPGRLIALASLLALAFTFLFFAGSASASTVVASPLSFNTNSCISATPPSQVVGLRETAWVTVSVSCSPVTTATYVQVKWGDGTIEDYPLNACQEVCHTPPYIIATSHAYTSVGAYQPTFCVVPAPVSTSPACTTVKIQVVIVDPPVS